MNQTVKDMWKATDPRNQASVPHPADDEYAPPVSSVKLPSRGIVYPPESPLYLCETVDIKAVTAKEENILASPALIKKGIVLTELMKACITNRTVDPDTMLVGDRNAVLVSIRVSAYGPIYNARVTCPDCGEESDYDFDLSKLTLKTLDVEPVGGPGTNEFSFKLPSNGREVRFKLMDAYTVNKLDRDMEALRKKTGREQGVTMRLLAQATSMAGLKDRSELPRAIENLPAQDSRAWRAYMDKIAPGVDMEQDFECPSCGKTNEVEIPIGPSFFWPSED
jgi:predicted RNA-binding Zn-ribbon protein involved in translation (DUF1610 family)